MSDATNTRNANEDAVSFAPAIFLPFKGVPAELPKTISREEKLNHILETLDKHHEAVRQNIVHIAISHQEKIAEKARQRLEEAGFLPIESYAEASGVSDEEEKANIKRLKYPARKDVKPGHYEYHGESIKTVREDGRSSTDNNGDDVHMPDVGDQSRARQIHFDAAQKVRRLIAATASNLEGYEVLAKDTRDVYVKALERERAKAEMELDENIPDRRGSAP